MGIHRFTRALDEMQRILIAKQGCKSIADEVKIRKFLYDIPDNIKKSIRAHLTNDMTYYDIVTK